jgi:hypothetical protein
MVLYVILALLAVLLGMGGMIVFFLFVVTDCEPYQLLIAFVILAVLALGLGLGAVAIENANTTTDIEVVQMEVNKIDITSVCTSNGFARNNCYITVGNKYVVEVTEKQYAALNVGDVVSVEVETKTVFGEVQKPTVRLKG